MMTPYAATRRHVIKINFMYFIIQCKIFSNEKAGSTVLLLAITHWDSINTYVATA